MFFAGFLLRLSRIKRSQDILMGKFGPTALNFGYDFFSISTFFFVSHNLFCLTQSILSLTIMYLCLSMCMCTITCICVCVGVCHALTACLPCVLIHHRGKRVPSMRPAQPCWAQEYASCSAEWVLLNMHHVFKTYKYEVAAHLWLLLHNNLRR